jgi:hypothetical protein
MLKIPESMDASILQIGKNCQALVEAQDKKKNRQTYHLHGLEDFRVKMSITFKLIYRFKTIPVNIPAEFFPRCGKASNKCHEKNKGTLKF